MIDIDLKGQNILVTGASDGIGKDIAAFLMKNGANVCIHYFKNKESAEALKNSYPKTNSQIFKANFDNTLEVEDFWKNLLASYNRIDAIVLNAGVFIKQDADSSTEQWYKSWKKTMRINLETPALLTKLGIDHFKLHGGGRFVYIASRAAFRGETQEYLAYAASKGGLVSLARSVARSFGKLDIKSFIIAPGFVKTAMADQFIADYGEKTILDEIALNELTCPSDLSPLVALMCSGALDHATGSTIDINAGSHIR